LKPAPSTRSIGSNPALNWAACLRSAQFVPRVWCRWCCSACIRWAAHARHRSQLRRKAFFGAAVFLPVLWASANVILGAPAAAWPGVTPFRPLLQATVDMVVSILLFAFLGAASPVVSDSCFLPSGRAALRFLLIKPRSARSYSWRPSPLSAVLARHHLAAADRAHRHCLVCRLPASWGSSYSPLRAGRRAFVARPACGEERRPLVRPEGRGSGEPSPSCPSTSCSHLRESLLCGRLPPIG